MSLKSFAKKLSITSHQLSKIINSELKKNFYAQVNPYQIEEAKQLLKAKPGKAVNPLCSFYDFSSAIHSISTRASSGFCLIAMVVRLGL